MQHGKEPGLSMHNWLLQSSFDSNSHFVWRLLFTCTVFFFFSFFFLSYMKRPRGTSGCSQCCSAGGHGGASEEDPDEGKFIPCHLASPSDTIQEFPGSHMTPGVWFLPQHDESSRRHMEQIEQRKEKAAELSSGRHANTDYAPKLTPYERKKQCSLCCVVVCTAFSYSQHCRYAYCICSYHNDGELVNTTWNLIYFLYFFFLHCNGNLKKQIISHATLTSPTGPNSVSCHETLEERC